MYRTILFPVDLTARESLALSLPVVRHYLEWCSPDLHVISVVPDLRMNLVSQIFSEDAETRILRQTESALADFVAEEFADYKRVTPHVCMGAAYQAIIDYADEITADLIIITSGRPELSDYLLGTNASRVVRHSRCSVLVVRE